MMVYEHLRTNTQDSTLEKIVFRLTPRLLIVMETGVPGKTTIWFLIAFCYALSQGSNASSNEIQRAISGNA